jgi:hypothetical protein
MGLSCFEFGTVYLNIRDSINSIEPGGTEHICMLLVTKANHF